MRHPKQSNEENKEVSQLTLRIRQTITSLGIVISVLAFGLTNGYSAVLLPQLKSFNSNSSENETADEVRVSSIEEESWIAAAAVLPMAPGCLISGALMEKVGRRMTGLGVSPIVFASWLIVALAGSVNMIIVGRFICGLSMGILAPLGPIYISETTEPKMRGILVNSSTVALTLGILLSHALGTWLNWRLTAYLCSIAPFACFIFFLIGKESPSWLMANRKFEKARKNWTYLRGTQAEYERVCMEVRKNVDTEGRRRPKKSVWRIIWSGQFLKPFGIVSLFFITSQLSGMNTVTFYSVELMANVSGPESAYIGSLLIDVVRSIASIVSCILAKKCTRRSLSLFSGIATAITLFILSGCLVFEIGLPWTPAVALIAYTAVVFIGLVPLPWVLCGELFSRECRGLGSGITTAIYFSSFFIVVKTGLGMLEVLHAYGTFMVYAVATLIGTLIIHAVLPETKDKSLEEIEKYFVKKSKATDGSKSDVKTEMLTSRELAPP